MLTATQRRQLVLTAQAHPSHKPGQGLPGTVLREFNADPSVPDRVKGIALQVLESPAHLLAVSADGFEDARAAGHYIDCDVVFVEEADGYLAMFIAR